MALLVIEEKCTTNLVARYIPKVIANPIVTDATDMNRKIKYDIWG